MNVAVDKGNVYFLQVTVPPRLFSRNTCALISYSRLFPLQVGRNIDIAFLVLCAHAMDQMFYDKDYD